MKAKLRLGFTNLLAGATTTASSEAPNFLGPNAREPERPFRPWKTTAVGDQSIVFDCGAAIAPDLMVLVHVNVATVRLQGNATDSWGSPSFNQAYTIGRNPFTRRYQHAAVLTGFNYRYVRLLIESQSPLDDQSVYAVGGLWLGVATVPPDDVLWDVQPRIVEPATFVGPAHNGWSQRHLWGDARLTLSLTRRTRTDRRSPGLDDHLQDWLEIDRQAWEADQFALFLNTGDARQGYIMRFGTAGKEWSRATRSAATSPWVLEEVTGPAGATYGTTSGAYAEGGTATVTAGTSTIAITLTNAPGGTTYRVRSAYASWATSLSVVSKTATTLTLLASAECPSGGGTLDWEIAYD